MATVNGQQRSGVYGLTGPNPDPKAPMRDGVERLIHEIVRPTEFGTLTLRTIHDPGCPCRNPHPVRHEGHCDGNTVRRTNWCRLPSMSACHLGIGVFLQHCTSAAVAFELGTAKSRPHWHYVATGSNEPRGGDTWCFPCLRGERLHEHTANGWWTWEFGHVDTTSIKRPLEAVGYALKSVGYTVKESIADDAEFERKQPSPNGRGVRHDGLWIKRWTGRNVARPDEESARDRRSAATGSELR